MTANPLKAAIRFNAIFTDRDGKTTEWDFHAASTADAGTKACDEAKLHNDRGSLPDIGKVFKIELWDFQAEEWFRWYL